uniref:hypothetical protein n=1 Tax=uncultured Draconibacterium sp. TaxID=1573823 RepID=UPI0032169639
MSIEEFYNFIKRSEEKEAYYKALYDGFSKKLPGSLAEIVFHHLPRLNEKKADVIKICEKYISEIWEVYNYVYSLNANGGPMADLRPVKKPTTRAEAEQKRLKEIQTIPRKYHKAYSEVFWESYEEELSREKYEYAIYEKMKEVFTEFYINDILDFESEYLRYFDRSIYLSCSCKFIEDIYSL